MDFEGNKKDDFTHSHFLRGKPRIIFVLLVLQITVFVEANNRWFQEWLVAILDVLQLI